MLTFEEAIEYSSNIVVAKISNVIGAELLYRTARNFGFGVASGIELPGEVNGELKKPSQWSGATLNSMAIGYEVGVTPMQIISAYAAVANQGVLMKPFVVRQVMDQHGELVAETHPQPIRQVVTRRTADQLTSFFRGVVERGTGISARNNLVSVAGKTGTSRKFVDGKYEVGNYTASFVGFLPAENPRLVCLVMLDHTREGGYTGGSASAPIFKAIVDLIVTSASWTEEPPPIALGGRKVVAVPDVGALEVGEATSMIEQCGFETQVAGSGRIVARQTPEAGARVPSTTVVKLSTEATGIPPREGYAIIPDVRRLSLRRALGRLMLERLDVSIAGSGVVIEQTPSPGVQVKVGSRVSIKCEAPGV
jgi:membrane peptidoglycan carboxypeptidase